MSFRNHFKPKQPEIRLSDEAEVIIEKWEENGMPQHTFGKMKREEILKDLYMGWEVAIAALLYGKFAHMYWISGLQSEKDWEYVDEELVVIKDILNASGIDFDSLIENYSKEIETKLEKLGITKRDAREESISSEKINALDGRDLYRFTFNPVQRGENRAQIKQAFTNIGFDAVAYSRRLDEVMDETRKRVAKEDKAK